MVKFPEAQARLFKNVFICKRCKTAKRAPIMKVLKGEIMCSKCGSKKLRVKKTKK